MEKVKRASGYGVMLVLKYKVWFYKVQDEAQYSL